MNAIRSATLLLALLGLSTVAIAKSNQELFFDAVTAVSPTVARTLKVIGAEYQAKCGAEPTVTQYKALGNTSEAFSFRLALANMGNEDMAGWPEETKTRYQALVAQQPCFPAGLE